MQDDRPCPAAFEAQDCGAPAPLLSHPACRPVPGGWIIGRPMRLLAFCLTSLLLSATLIPNTAHGQGWTWNE